MAWRQSFAVQLTRSSSGLDGAQAVAFAAIFFTAEAVPARGSVAEDALQLVECAMVVLLPLLLGRSLAAGHSAEEASACASAPAEVCVCLQSCAAGAPSAYLPKKPRLITPLFRLFELEKVTKLDQG